MLKFSRGGVVALTSTLARSSGRVDVHLKRGVVALTSSLARRSGRVDVLFGEEINGATQNGFVRSQHEHTVVHVLLHSFTKNFEIFFRVFPRCCTVTSFGIRVFLSKYLQYVAHFREKT